MKLLYLICAIYALLSARSINAEDIMHDGKVEQSTESPIADLTLVDPKDDMKAKNPAEAQPHTIADFVIQPVIALKPRPAESEINAEGKQADTTTAAPSPWQFFSFSNRPGLTSSVSSLAGTVTGWLGIPFPSLIDTPVAESTTTSTTVRPDVVVKLQQRRSTRRPLITIDNENRPYNSRRKNQNHINNNLDESDEYNDDYVADNNDDDFEDDNNNNDVDDDDNDDFSNGNDDNEDDFNNEETEEELEDDEPVQQQNYVRRRTRPSNNNYSNNQRRRVNNNNYNNISNQRKRYQKRRQPQESDEYEQDDNDDEADADDEDFYYSDYQKRSHGEPNFIQRGQQTLLNQIRQLSRGQSPAEVATAIRESQKGSTSKKRHQQATLIINRNGQTIYVTPELLQAAEATNDKIKPAPQQYQYYQPSAVSSNKNKHPIAVYPQPPLTSPLKRKGKPTQYVTIPWNQLGMAPPNQVLAIAEGLQSQPLILNIPQSAIQAMQNPTTSKRKQVIKPEAVPLLADASIMDIFKPPRIPPARTPSNVKPTKKAGLSGSNVVIATQSKPGRQRIRPGTIVEKAPADAGINAEQEASEAASNNSESTQYIVVGPDGEAGLGRNQFLNYLQNGQITHRSDRQLHSKDETVESHQESEQVIPVKVIAAEETTVDDKVEAVEETKIEESLAESAVLSEVNDAK